MDNDLSVAQDSTGQSPQGRARASSHKVSYPRQRAIKACQLCRTRRIKCDNKRPACSSCVKIGAECFLGNEENPVIDAGSLRVLQKLDDLEKLVRSLQPRGSSYPPTTPPEQQVRQLCVTTEEILSWKVFQGNYDTRRDLKALLRVIPTNTSITSPISLNSSMTDSDSEPTSYKRLLDNFFRNVHGKNPMLDEAKIRHAVHLMCLDGPGWDAESCLSLLVCALGSIASSFNNSAALYSNSNSMATAQSYFSAAQKRMGMYIGNGGLLEAQCFFYSGVFLMSKLQPLQAWRFFVQALANCQDLECANPKYMSSSIRTVNAMRGLPAEECVYWSCWKSELELRMCLSLPDFAYDDLSYPLLFPTPPTTLEGADATSWYFYLSEISLRRLEHRVRDEIGNCLKADATSFGADLLKCTRTVEGLAEEWVQSLPPIMSFYTPQTEDDVLKFILRGHFLNLWEVIYWPWVQLFLDQGLQIPEVERYVQKALQIGIDRIHINKPGFRHRHHGTWLMLQSCMRSALSLLAVAYRAEAANLLPSDWKDAVFDVIELLRYWQYDAADAADRLRILEELVSGL